MRKVHVSLFINGLSVSFETKKVGMLCNDKRSEFKDRAILPGARTAFTLHFGACPRHLRQSGLGQGLQSRAPGSYRR